MVDADPVFSSASPMPRPPDGGPVSGTRSDRHLPVAADSPGSPLRPSLDGTAAARPPEPAPPGPDPIESEPVIRVSIGRIEVRAVAPGPQRLSGHESRQPIESLDEYLRRTARRA
jgi:hypothetical protein